MTHPLGGVKIFGVDAAMSKQWYKQQKLRRRCTQCGDSLPDKQKSVACQTCKERLVIQNKCRKQKLIAENKCVSCQSPCENGKQQCNDCLSNYSGYQKAKRQQRKANGLCSVCGSQLTDADSTQCSPCRKRKQKNRRNARFRNSQNGCCVLCGSSAKKVTKTLCEVCWFKKAAEKHIGSGTLWKELKEKLVSQNARCPYSGLMLIPGESASIDHIVPISKGGLKTLNNIQWVHRWVNIMKHTNDATQFAQMFHAFISECHSHLTEHICKE